MTTTNGTVAVENSEENVIQFTSLTPEQLVSKWDMENKISEDAVAKLLEEGFTSLEAIRLLDADDLSRSKISRGQKKLILECVRVLNGGKTSSIMTTGSLEPPNNGPLNNGPPNNGPPNNRLLNNGPQTSSAGASAVSAPTINNQSGTLLNQNGGTNSDASLDQSSHSSTQDGNARLSSDAYIQGLLAQLTSGQLQARNGISSDSLIGGILSSDSRPGVTQTSTVTSSPQIQSYRDPQIYLSAAANGKSASTHYDIVDFVSGNVEEEIVVGGSGSHQVVLKSGPKKPKLESITLAQWTIANLAILYKLNGDGKLAGEGIMDYLSYTTKVCQLVQRYNLVSVLLYDREYRKLQCSHEFRWGTDVPHLHSVYLQPRLPRPGSQAPNKAYPNSKPQTSSSPLTLDGKVICKLFNTKNGCHYKEACRFVHQCSHPGCHLLHSAVTHSPKN